MPSDEELMTTYVAGDARAFEVLFDRYGDLLLRYMQRGYVTRADAEDLAQQVFLQLHRARHDYQAGRPLRPWLMTIARNVKRDFLRRLPRLPSLMDLAEFTASAAGPAENQMEARSAVRRAIARLPDPLRVVLELHWQHHLPYRRVARKLGISESAAKVRAHRAYQSLRRSLVEFDAGGENRSSSAASKGVLGVRKR